MGFTRTRGVSGQSRVVPLFQTMFGRSSMTLRPRLKRRPAERPYERTVAITRWRFSGVRIAVVDGNGESLVLDRYSGDVLGHPGQPRRSKG